MSEQPTQSQPQQQQQPPVDKVDVLAKQLAETQAMLQQLLLSQQQQADAQPSTSNQSMETDAATPGRSLLHSLSIRPHYDWSAPSPLSQALGFHQPLFDLANLLADEDKHRIIEEYPPLQEVDYKPPSTLPIAHRQMNHSQRLEDSALNDIQYLLSGIFRPLDVLGNELYQLGTSAPDVTERLLFIVADIRRLLMNTCAHITHSRNNIALRGVNRNFTAPSPVSSKKYTMSTDVFHSAISQQTSTTKALREAQQINRRRRVVPQPQQSNNNASTSAVNGLQFFRSGPSSQHGGFHSQPKNSNNPYRQQQSGQFSTHNNNNTNKTNNNNRSRQ